MKKIKKLKPSEYFLDGMNKDIKSLFYDIIDLGFDFIEGKTRNHKVLNYQTPEFFKNKIKGAVPQNGAGIDAIKPILEEIGRYSISQSDVNYLAFPDSGNSIPALLGEIYAKFLNQNLIAFDRSAPYATFIEIQLFEWLREMVGYDYKEVSELKAMDEVSAVATSGGQMSNHIAILTALNSKYPSIKNTGIRGLSVSPKVVLAGKITHYSMNTAIHHLGLGYESIIDVKSDKDFTTDTKDLERILADDSAKGEIFMVAAAAGNTRTGGLDNLKEISRICKKYNTWFHVDACHGGSLIFSDKLKKRDLTGIEEADSITLDPHKGLFITYPSSFVIFKKRDSLVAFTRYEEQVRNGESWDLGMITPHFGSRGFESIKLWLLIKIMGKRNLAKVMEERDKHSKYAAELIKESGYFVLFHDMTFYRLAFVYYPDSIKKIVDSTISSNSKVLQEIRKCVDFYTHQINQELYEEGNVCFDEFKMFDVPNATGLYTPESKFSVISLTVGNPLFTEKTLSNSLNILFKKCEEKVKYMSEDIMQILQHQKSSINSEEKVFGPAGWN